MYHCTTKLVFTLSACVSLLQKMLLSSIVAYDRTKALFIVALTTSLLWYLYWIIMAPVELDIADLVNWYFFMKLHLKKMYNIYKGFMLMHNWCPLVVVMSFVVTKAFGQQRHVVMTSQFIYLVVLLYNILLFIYILFMGQKIRDLFLLIFPLRMVHPIGSWLSFFFSYHHLFIVNMAAFTVYWLLHCYVKHGHRYHEFSSKLRGLLQPGLCGAVKRFFLMFLFPLLLLVLISWAMHSACAPCIAHDTHSTLPNKPALIAHRGCGYSAPENSLAAFSEATTQQEVVGLETDVQISTDGELFLLHDPYLVRTTDSHDKCGSHPFDLNASLLNFTSGSCPLESLNVGKWFVKEKNGSFANDHLQLYASQMLPKFRDFLEIAKHSNRIVIFDVYEPPVGHAYHSTYLNVTLEAIVSSGIPLNKVWWLPKQQREWALTKYPEMSQTTKTKDTRFEDFPSQHIQKINDDWSTPLKTFRKYQASNLTINMFFVDSPFMYRYAWCLGVQSVTTDNCQQLRSINRNPLYEACQYWQYNQTPNQTQLSFGSGAIFLQLFLFVMWEGLKITRHRKLAKSQRHQDM